MKKIKTKELNKNKNHKKINISIKKYIKNIKKYKKYIKNKRRRPHVFSMRAPFLSRG